MATGDTQETEERGENLRGHGSSSGRARRPDSRGVACVMGSTSRIENTLSSIWKPAYEQVRKAPEFPFDLALAFMGHGR
jgi:hypothetical protein